MENERGERRRIVTPSHSRSFRLSCPERILALLLRCALGVIFLYAGFLKARDPGAFAGTLRGYRFFSEFAVLPLAAYLPYLEILVGLALICGLLYSGALLLAGGLLIAFDTVLLFAMWRGLDVDCGCFGHGHSASLGAALIRNASLLVVWCALVRLFLKRLGEPISAPIPP